MQELVKSVEFWQIAAAVVTVAGGLSLLLPKAKNNILSPLRIWITTMIAVPRLVSDIKGQVFNNGGSSLKDSVDRVCNRLDVVEGRLYARGLMDRDAKWWADAKGKTTNINNAYSKLFGCSLKDAKDFNFLQFLPDAVADDVLGAWIKTVELGAEYNKRMELLDINGNSIGDVEIHAIPVKSTTGKVYSYEGTIKERNPRCPYNVPCANAKDKENEKV